MLEKLNAIDNVYEKTHIIILKISCGNLTWQSLKGLAELANSTVTTLLVSHINNFKLPYINTLIN